MTKTSQNNEKRETNGFTLIELLLVLAVIGLIIALILPRAMRARTESNYSMVRQYGSEIACNIMTWAESQARAQRPGCSFTVKDFLYDDITELDGAGIVSGKLIDKYTGNDDYDGVEKLFPPEKMPRNPFNEVSYFSKANDDTEVPGKKTGLLYLAVQKDPRDQDYLNFYLLFTSTSRDSEGGCWHGDMSHEDPDRIRTGVFVARLYNDEEYGGPEKVIGGR